MINTASSLIKEKLMEKIMAPMLNIIESEVFREQARIQTSELLCKYYDEPFYMALDNYLSNRNIMGQMIKDCEEFVEGNNEFDIRKFAEEFYKENRSQIPYYSMNSVKNIFAQLYQIIFNCRFQIGKFSPEEKVVAHTKKIIGEAKKDIQKSLTDILAEIKREAGRNSVIANDKKFQFVEIYESKLFLENEHDKPLSLKDMYIMPHYKENGKKHEDLEQCIHEFMSGGHKENVLIILGKTSVGKSSMICDLVYKNQYRDDIIALSMKTFDGNQTLLNGLRKELRCNDNELGGRVLILDGYDETQVIKAKDANLNKICLDFIAELQRITPEDKPLKIIMTVKTSYFDTAGWKENYDNVRVIEILDFEKRQIEDFRKRYSTQKNIGIKNFNFIEKNLKEGRLGIIANPMILYMICHYREKLGDNVSKESIYENAFSERGILFTSKYKGKGKGEDASVINEAHEIIREIAFNSYGGNPYILPKDIYEESFKNNVLRRFFETIIELQFNDEEIRVLFRHESIRHYFIAEYIYNQLEKICKEKKLEDKKVLKVIDDLFSVGNIEDEISRFLNHFIKVRKLVEYEEKNKVLLNSIKYILEKNCIFYIDKSQAVLLDRIHNVFDGYWKIFTSIYISICKKQKKEFLLKDYLCDEIIWKNLARLLKNGAFYKLYLRGANFDGSDLRGVILKQSDLRNGSLRNVDLRGASLIGTKFDWSNLENANLNGADLCKAKFANASLKRMKLRGSVLKECEFEKGKDIEEIKFSYSNIMHVNGISEEELQNCFIFDEQGKMIHYNDWKSHKALG